MSVILVLILASLVVAGGFLLAFIWAVRSGQYEDTQTPSMRILMDEDGPAASPVTPAEANPSNHSA
jgi:cbb3-type cytochrome oxidase maturation protein